MENAKVKLPKEVAEAIDYIRSDGQSNEDIVCYALGTANGTIPTVLRELVKRRRFDDLLKALVNGYEVEETPEDKVRELCEEYAVIGCMNDRQLELSKVAIGAVKATLNVLNISIEGVNT